MMMASIKERERERERLKRLMPEVKLSRRHEVVEMKHLYLGVRHITGQDSDSLEDIIVESD